MSSSTTTSISRKAESVWKGDVKGGYGLLTLESGLLRETRFSLNTRTGEDDSSQTNPEELIAAAAASCFSMALSKVLTERETIASRLIVNANVDIEMGDDGISLSKLSLTAEGIVPASDPEGFEEAVRHTEKICPVLKTLKPGFETIEITAKLRN